MTLQTLPSLMKMTESLNKNVCLISGLDSQRYVELISLLTNRVNGRNPIYRISANRDKLCNASDYFKALLGPNFVERDQNEIVLSGFDGITLELIVEYCHEGEICLTPDNIESVIEAARSMSILALEEKCCKYLESTLDVENCVTAFYLSDLYVLCDVRDTLFRFICSRFQIIDLKDFQILPQERMNEFLSHKYVEATEDYLLEALMMWVEYDKENRITFFREMIKSISLDAVSFEVSVFKTKIREISFQIFPSLCSYYVLSAQK